jgi:hypothetical protein
MISNEETSLEARPERKKRFMLFLELFTILFLFFLVIL